MTIRQLLTTLGAALLIAAPELAAAAAKRPATPADAIRSSRPKKPPVAKKPPPAAIAPKKKETGREKKMQRLYAGTHGAWAMQCFRTPEKRVFCNLGQVVAYKISAKEAKKLKAAKVQGPPRLVLLIHGTAQGETVTFVSPSRWAKESRIIARIDKGYGFGLDAPEKRLYAPISPKESAKIIEKMKAGRLLAVKFLPAIGDVQAVRFNLAGFTSGVNRMRAVMRPHVVAERARAKAAAAAAAKAKPKTTPAPAVKPAAKSSANPPAKKSP